MKLDNELGVLGALLGDPLEEDVGVNATGARGHADNGCAGAIMSFKQAGKQFRIQSVVFLYFPLD